MGPVSHPSGTLDLALIDGIGPFFRKFDKRRINWSKIPFTDLATVGSERESEWAAIREDVARLADRVVGLGYNAITLDDLAHLTDHEWHEPGIRQRIAVFRDEFRKIFAILREKGLRIFVTSDYLTTSAGVDERLHHHPGPLKDWYCEMVERFLDDFPEIAGVILRIGESDGIDVGDSLRSRLVLRSSRDVNQLLRQLVPLFERRQRTLIFRTWTVGAYLIGDLIWNRVRLVRCLRGIDSKAFIVSMKYGETDFFRYLALNRQFFRVKCQKLIEFQARREYEGAGEYPSFIGWDCERYSRELDAARGVVGFSVWCQTGGWHAFRRRAFLDDDAFWIELNTAVAIRVLRDRMQVEDAVESFVGAERAPTLLNLLRRSEIVIRELLYIEEFARQRLYFRRVRIPPLMHVYWDCIFINHPVKKIMSHFVHDPETSIRSGEAAFQHFEAMEKLAEEGGFQPDDIRFMRDTFEIILLARRYYLLPFDDAMEQALRAAKKSYKQAWPRELRQRYRVKTSFKPVELRRQTLSWLVRILIRRRQGYRTVLDRFFTLNVLSLLYRLFHTRHQAAMPKFMRTTAMGIDSIFR